MKITNSCFKAALIHLLILLWLTGCNDSPSSQKGLTSSDEGAYVMVSVDSVNYQHDWELTYTLIDLRNNQTLGGGIVGVLEGAGGKNY